MTPSCRRALSVAAARQHHASAGQIKQPGLRRGESGQRRAASAAQLQPAENQVRRLAQEGLVFVAGGLARCPVPGHDDPAGPVPGQWDSPAGL